MSRSRFFTLLLLVRSQATVIKARSISRWSLVLLSLLLCACSAPPDKPPVPKPLVSDAAPSPRGLEDPAGAAPGGAQADGEGSPGSDQGYGAASANAAEVEEEEVAADGTTRVISSSRPPPAASAAGGGAMPPSSAAPQRAMGGTSGGGPTADAQGAGTRYSDMQGVDIDAGKSADDASGGRGQRAADLAPSGITDSAATRPGVRGGLDESGATVGTPAAAQVPPPSRSPAAVRDNDILAQQLREAAQQEKDPALREKLWAEYRKYKAGL